MTVYDLEVTRPATTVQQVEFRPINGTPNPGRVEPLSLVQSGARTVNLSPVTNATPDSFEE